MEYDDVDHTPRPCPTGQNKPTSAVLLCGKHSVVAVLFLCDHQIKNGCQATFLSHNLIFMCATFKDPQFKNLVASKLIENNTCPSIM